MFYSLFANELLIKRCPLPVASCLRQVWCSRPPCSSALAWCSLSPITFGGVPVGCRGTRSARWCNVERPNVRCWCSWWPLLSLRCVGARVSLEVKRATGSTQPSPRDSLKYLWLLAPGFQRSTSHQGQHAEIAIQAILLVQPFRGIPWPRSPYLLRFARPDQRRYWARVDRIVLLAASQSRSALVVRGLRGHLVCSMYAI